jgi:hypothetical protein
LSSRAGKRISPMNMTTSAARAAFLLVSSVANRFPFHTLLLLALLSASEARSADPSPLAPPWNGKVPARETHPCLFFGPEEIPKLKERIQQEPYKSCDDLLAQRPIDSKRCTQVTASKPSPTANPTRLLDPERIYCVKRRKL